MDVSRTRYVRATTSARHYAGLSQLDGTFSGGVAQQTLTRRLLHLRNDRTLRV
jgi:hypothetical protein